VSLGKFTETTDVVRFPATTNVSVCVFLVNLTKCYHTKTSKSKIFVLVGIFFFGKQLINNTKFCYYVLLYY